MNGTRVAVSAGIASTLLATSFATAARALPVPTPPPPLPRSATATPSAPPLGPVLPYGSPIFFVLDDKVNSGTTAPGTVVHMHLRAPLVLDGTTLAPAGAPATFTVVNTSKAQTGDVDGAIQIHLDPFAIEDGKLTLPIRAYHEYLTVEMTAGQLSTRGATDEIADVFVPYHSIYHALRKGRQMVLPQGSVLRAETDATLNATDPKAPTISTPPPFVSTFDAPHADLTPAPFYTPNPIRPHPLPKGKATLPPRPPSPSPAASSPADPSTTAAPSSSPQAR